MPIFEYVCQKCGKDFEALVRSETVPECPGCHSTDLKKQLSVFGTAASAPDLPPMPVSPCASCGNARGPGSCGLH